MGKIVQLKRKHVPYHCDMPHGGWLRDHDVIDRRGHSNKYRSWALVRDTSGELKMVKTEPILCMQCVAEGAGERLLKQDAESIRDGFAGKTPRRERKAR